jgi:hypothetical protein
MAQFNAARSGKPLEQRGCSSLLTHFTAGLINADVNSTTTLFIARYLASKICQHASAFSQASTGLPRIYDTLQAIDGCNPSIFMYSRQMTIATHHLVSTCLSCVFSLTLCNLGNFLLQNYKQALECIRDIERELIIFTQATGYAESDFLKWHEEERHFLSVATKKEPVLQTLKVSYVGSLEKLYGYE